MEFLNDAYTVNPDRNNYREFITQVADATYVVKTHGAEMQFFSYCDSITRPDGKATFFALLPEYEDAFEEGHMIPNCGITLSISDELKNQMEATNKLLLLIGSDMYLVSEFAISLLNRWAGVTGDAAANPSHTLIRNLHMASAIQKRNPRLQLVYRKDGHGVRKVFAVMSGSYTFNPQTVVLDVLDMLQKGHELTVEHTEITHEETSVRAALPREEGDYQELFKGSHVDIPAGTFRPILEVKTSDIGRSSLVVRSLLEYNNDGVPTRVIMDEIPFVHTGAMDFAEKVDDTIFANIRKLPETLISLMGQPIMDYSKVDLFTETGKSKNREAIEKVIRYGFKSSCADAFGGCTKKKRDLINALLLERDLSAQYTLYDIAVIFLSIPDRASGISASVAAALRKDCGKVPYALTRYGKKDESDEEVTLLPE